MPTQEISAVRFSGEGRLSIYRNWQVYLRQGNNNDNYEQKSGCDPSPHGAAPTRCKAYLPVVVVVNSGRHYFLENSRALMPLLRNNLVRTQPWSLLAIAGVTSEHSYNSRPRGDAKFSHQKIQIAFYCVWADI